MIAFLLRWALYTLLIPIAVVLMIAVFALGAIAIGSLYEVLGSWFWLVGLLLFAAALALPES